MAYHHSATRFAWSSLCLTFFLLLLLPVGAAAAGPEGRCNVNASNQCPANYTCVADTNTATVGRCQCTFGKFEAPLHSSLEGLTICDYLIHTEGNSILSLIQLVVDVITGVTVAAGLVIVTAAGYVYMTAGGDASKVGRAKTMVQMALLGIALAMTAFLILNTISPQFASEVEEPQFGPAP